MSGRRPCTGDPWTHRTTQRWHSGRGWYYGCVCGEAVRLSFQTDRDPWLYPGELTDFPSKPHGGLNRLEARRERWAAWVSRARERDEEVYGG